MIQERGVEASGKAKGVGGAGRSAHAEATLPGNVPIPNYNSLSENLRRVTPNGIQCSIFCGGRRCKYETPDAWDAAHMAIDGIYSHWITDNILAMSRPSTEIIKKRNIIHQFQSAGIRSVVNLQVPGEHASCGSQLESSGFTYDPNIFMENNIYFYNFGWKDYGDATTNGLLDMVKVMAFALEEGKVAVHCHAGLGRTGVLIACYLVYYLRARANDAIRFVRLKRPNSVQTRGQILCVQEFEQFLLPHCVVFCNKDFGKDKKQQEFTLPQYLQRQSVILHGYESRAFKYLPKILFVLCERILQLCRCCTFSIHSDGSNIFTRNFLVAHLKASSSSHGQLRANRLGSAESRSSSNVESTASTRRPSTDLGDLSGSTGDEEQNSSPAACISPDMPSCASGMSGMEENSLDAMLGDGVEGQTLQDNLCFRELNSQGSLEKESEREEIIPYNIEDAVQALLANHLTMGEGTKKYVRQLRIDLNHKQSAWGKLKVERNLHVLACLVFEWLEHLKTPILTTNDLSYVVVYSKKPEACLRKLDTATQYTLEYVVQFLVRMQPASREDIEDLIRRFVCSLTHQSVTVRGTLRPAGKTFQKLREGTYQKVMEFMLNLYDMLYDKINTNTYLPITPDSPGLHMIDQEI